LWSTGFKGGGSCDATDSAANKLQQWVGKEGTQFAASPNCVVCYANLQKGVVAEDHLEKVKSAYELGTETVKLTKCNNKNVGKKSKAACKAHVNGVPSASGSRDMSKHSEKCNSIAECRKAAGETGFKLRTPYEELLTRSMMPDDSIGTIGQGNKWLRTHFLLLAREADYTATSTQPEPKASVAPQEEPAAEAPAAEAPAAEESAAKPEAKSDDHDDDDDHDDHDDDDDDDHDATGLEYMTLRQRSRRLLAEDAEIDQVGLIAEQPTEHHMDKAMQLLNGKEDTEDDEDSASGDEDDDEDEDMQLSLTDAVVKKKGKKRLGEADEAQSGYGSVVKSVGSMAKSAACD